MRFRVVRAARDDSPVPERLSEVEPLVPARRPGAHVPVHPRRASATTAGWTINGRRFDPDVALADIPLGRTEVWRFVTDVHHPVHVHLDPFQVLRRGGGGPGPYDAGWKDTVDLRAGRDRRRRRAVHRPRRPVRLHCHNLEHEDMAMMATIRTV